jgi:hypothetical protein
MPLRCAGCDDVIGVYEPLVHVVGGVSRHTSLAAEPAVSFADGDGYHPACFERLWQ